MRIYKENRQLGDIVKKGFATKFTRLRLHVNEYCKINWKVSIMDSKSFFSSTLEHWEELYSWRVYSH